MARTFDGVDDYIEASSSVVSDYPFTMVCWFRSNSDSASQQLIGVSDASDSDRYSRLTAVGSADGDPIRAEAREDGATKFAETSTAYSIDTWHHAAGVFVDYTVRSAYLDGGGKGTTSGWGAYALFHAGIDTTTIGRLTRPSPVSYVDGDIAEAAIWDVALTDAEVAILAAGYSPLCLTHRLSDLVLYQDLIRPLDRPGIGPSMTATGTTVSEHAPMIYPSSPMVMGPSFGPSSLHSLPMTGVGAA